MSQTFPDGDGVRCSCCWATDLFRLGLLELERKYPPVPETERPAKDKRETAAAFGPLLLRPGATHVQLEINAVENVCNNLTNPEFDGHLADAAFLIAAAVPEPSASCSGA